MRSRDGWAARTAFAVVALYGLLLSTFLGAMAPAVPRLPAALLCQDGGASPADPHAPVHRPDCCTLGCMAAPVAPPQGRSAVAPAPTWHVVARGPARVALSLPRSPGFPPLPRGPPAA